MLNYIGTLITYYLPALLHLYILKKQTQFQVTYILYFKISNNYFIDINYNMVTFSIIENAQGFTLIKNQKQFNVIFRNSFSQLINYPKTFFPFYSFYLTISFFLDCGNHENKCNFPFVTILRTNRLYSWIRMQVHFKNLRN